MKKPLYALILAAALPLGCATATSPTPPVAPGYFNAADQQMGQILAGAHSFYTTMQTQSAAGQVTLSTTEKSAFNDFGTSLNLADTIYLGYHNGTQTAAAAQAAVNTVQQKQSALPALAVTK